MGVRPEERKGRDGGRKACSVCLNVMKGVLDGGAPRTTRDTHARTHLPTCTYSHPKQSHAAPPNIRANM